MKTKTNVKKETFKAFNRLKKGERFQADEFAKEIETRTGEHHHVDTYLRYLREFRKMTGRMIVNVDKGRSVYEVIS